VNFQIPRVGWVAATSDSVRRRPRALFQSPQNPFLRAVRQLLVAERLAARRRDILLASFTALPVADGQAVPRQAPGQSR
jgi:hypothetical protein